MSDERPSELRLNPGLVLFPEAGGAHLVVWVEAIRSKVELSVDELSMLLAFGDGRSVEVVAADLPPGADQEEFLELVGSAVEAQLLVPVEGNRDFSGEEASDANEQPSERESINRLRQLFDTSDFHLLRADEPGIVSAIGTVEGRKTIVLCEESGMPVPGTHKIIEIQKAAEKFDAPIVYLFCDGQCMFDPGDEEAAFVGPASWGQIYLEQTTLRYSVPQIFVVLGTAYFAKAFSARMADVVIMASSSRLSVATTEVPGATLARGEDVGAPEVHLQTGVVDLVCASEGECLVAARQLTSLMSGQRSQPMDPESFETKHLEKLKSNRAFDIRHILPGILDQGLYLELQETRAPELFVGLSRLAGWPVGLVANNSIVKAGLLTAEACRKGADFVSLCSRRGIPLLFFVDAPAVDFGRRADEEGIILAASRMMRRVADANCPRLTVIMRRCYTGAMMAMCGPSMRPDYIAILDTGRLMIARHTNDHSTIPERASWLSELRKRSWIEALDGLSNIADSPADRAGRGVVDELLDIHGVRDALAMQLELLSTGRQNKGKWRAGPQRKNGSP